MLRFAVIVLALLILMPAHAEDFIDLSRLAPEQDIYNRLKVFEDKTASLKIADIAGRQNQLFQKYNHKHAYGYSPSAFWFHQKLYNPLEKPLLLYLANGRVNFIDVYLLQNNKLVYQQRHGSSVNLQETEVQHRLPSFRLRVAEKTTLDLFMRYQAKDNILVTPVLYQPKAFHQYHEKLAYFYGAYFGVLLSLLVYNSLSAFASGQKVLFLYSFFIALTIVTNFLLLNFASVLFGWLRSESMIIVSNCLANIMIIGFFEFAFALFRLKHYAPLSVKTVRYYYWLVLFSILLLVFSDLTLSTPVFIFNMLLALMLGLLILFQVVKNKLPYAWWFTIGWLGFQVSLTLLSLAWAGLIDYQTHYLFYMHLATLFETIVFSFILAMKYQAVYRESHDKTELLAMVGHDIRQPLQAMMLYKDALESEVNSTEGKSLLVALNESIHGLYLLLSSLLNVSQIQSGKVKVQKEKVSVSEVVNSVVESLAPLAEQKQLAIILRIKDATVISDPVLLATIIRNLLANAIRYVEQGKILLSGRERADYYLLQVWDTGPGMETEQLKKVFSQYYQMNHFKKNEGVGLGLFICKHFANKLDIQLDICSKKGKGTVFSLKLEKSLPVKLPASHAEA